MVYLHEEIVVGESMRLYRNLFCDPVVKPEEFGTHRRDALFTLLYGVDAAERAMCTFRANRTAVFDSSRQFLRPEGLSNWLLFDDGIIVSSPQIPKRIIFGENGTVTHSGAESAIRIPQGPRVSLFPAFFPFRSELRGRLHGWLNRTSGRSRCLPFTMGRELHAIAGEIEEYISSQLSDSEIIERHWGTDKPKALFADTELRGYLSKDVDFAFRRASVALPTRLQAPLCSGDAGRKVSAFYFVFSAWTADIPHYFKPNSVKGGLYRPGGGADPWSWVHSERLHTRAQALLNDVLMAAARAGVFGDDNRGAPPSFKVIMTREGLRYSPYLRYVMTGYQFKPACAAGSGDLSRHLDEFSHFMAWEPFRADHDPDCMALRGDYPSEEIVVNGERPGDAVSRLHLRRRTAEHFAQYTPRFDAVERARIAETLSEMIGTDIGDLCASHLGRDELIDYDLVRHRAADLIATIDS